MAKRSPRRWSDQVTQRSNGLDLEEGVFTWKDPKRIAASIKRSGQRSRRKKADSFRSALSMLTFYINRAGRNLPASRRRTLELAERSCVAALGEIPSRAVEMANNFIKTVCYG